MNKYCINCSFYSKISDINGMCFIIGGMDKKGVLIIDKIDILKKVSEPDQIVYTPVIVQNLFGCAYHKRSYD